MKEKQFLAMNKEQRHMAIQTDPWHMQVSLRLRREEMEEEQKKKASSKGGAGASSSSSSSSLSSPSILQTKGEDTPKYLQCAFAAMTPGQRKHALQHDPRFNQDSLREVHARQVAQKEQEMASLREFMLGLDSVTREHYAKQNPLLREALESGPAGNVVDTIDLTGEDD